MREITRRSVAGIAVALSVRQMAAQSPAVPPPSVPGDDPTDVRLPNGKRQRDEILKSEYNQNLKDARQLMELTKTFELDLEKSDGFVLSLGLLKQLDEIEKLTRRIRGRMRK